MGSEGEGTGLGPIRRALALAAAIALISAATLFLSAERGAAVPLFTQQAYATPQSTVTSTLATYATAQVAGDTNVLIIGWNNATSSISAVTDTAGNTYALAAPTVRGTGLSQAIYYAANIRASTAGTNTVSVTFDAATAYPDLRILEYSGLDPAGPFDKAASAAGTSASPSSGSVTTTVADEVLVGGGTTVKHFTGPGSGYTARAITVPDGDIAEDRVVSATGSYSATAPLSQSAAWVMQLATFKAAPTSPTTTTTAATTTTTGPTTTTAPGTTSSSASSSTTSTSAPATTTTTAPGTPATPVYEQLSVATPQTPVAAVGATFPNAQAAGDTNVVIIGWNNATSNVTSVTDTAGNTYAVAAPTVRGTGLSQAIYYATNIRAAVAGTNTVTVTFNTATAYPDLRILEYGGLDPVSPFDKAASAAGTSTAANSGSVTTTSPNELLVGGGTTARKFTAAGSGYTLRVVTAQDGDIAEDRSVTATGSYSATAPNSFSSPWVMQLATFRVATNPPPTTTTTSSTTSTTSTSTSTTTTSTPASTTTTSTPASTTTTSTPSSRRPRPRALRRRPRPRAPRPRRRPCRRRRRHRCSREQTVATPQTPVTAVSATYLNAEVAGDTNVVIIGWNNATSNIASVTDTAGNTYAVAAPTVRGTGLSQAIYYAKSIRASAAGANTVTATFNASTAYPDLRILEYGGLDPDRPVRQGGVGGGDVDRGEQRVRDDDVA